MTPDMERYGIPTIAVATGVMFVWAGIKGVSVLQAVQDIIKGQPPTQAQTVMGLSTGISPATGNTPAGQAPGNWQGNEALGQMLAAQAGWLGLQWTALDALWNRESGWNNRAQNPSSGAYGIPQALPYSQMPKAGWPESAGGTSDPATQIQWGIDYIKGRYGDAVQAWTHEQQKGWY